MKTIAEISVERGVHRTTLNKAIERGAFPARKSGDTWLIDDESAEFKQWLAGTGKGRPRKFSETIIAEPPVAPAWVTSRAGRYAWKNDHSWRGDAAKADRDEPGAEQYRHFLLREAQRLYSEK